ncbi:MAG TPA: BON domain-containing protein [Gammaproteobacteria bacterium]|nr:BON domain-containing protein [Gammaproteobacteria bacterium]
MNEDSIATRIIAAYERASAVNLHQWPLTVNAGETLELLGTTPDIAAKRLAYHVAQEVVGDRPVVDRLRVAVTRERPDNELRQSVLHRLMTEPVFLETPLREPPENADGGILVDAHDGTVRLDGEVRSLSHHRLAEVLAWWTPGVADVDNRLRVNPPEEDNDDELADALRIVLEKEPALDRGQLKVGVRDQVVTLEGLVQSEANRHVAVWDCWYVPGVRQVRDSLTVQH